MLWHGVHPGPSTGAADQLAVQSVRLPVDNLFHTTQVLSGWLGTAFPAGGRLCRLPGSSAVALVRWLQASPKCVKPPTLQLSHTSFTPCSCLQSWEQALPGQRGSTCSPHPLLPHVRTYLCVLAYFFLSSTSEKLISHHPKGTYD